MKASEVLEILKGAVSAAQEAGVTHVATENLSALVSNLEDTASKSPEGISAGDAAMEAYKAELAALGNTSQQEHESNLEMLRATVATGQSALKSALLINGGAAVAILAFIGNAWGKPQAATIISGLAYGLSLFVWGVLSAATASGATYFSQAGFGGDFGEQSPLVGRIGRGLAITLGIGAYILFACAAWRTYVSLSG